MILLIFALMIVFVGCIRNTSSIVGKWYSEQDGLTMTLNEDGTFYLEDETIEHGDLLSGTYRVEGNQLIYMPTNEAELANTYTLTKDTLVVTYGDYTSTLKRVEK
jgi:hypothetical protein